MSDTVSSLPERIQSRTSYSIEAEDLLLNNAWANLVRDPGQSRGVYLDLGASHPVNHSNTYFFYELGWRGYCVEANPDLCTLYQEHRPQDKVYNIGIAPEDGVLTYHRFKQYLNNGFLPQKIVDEHIQRGQQYLDKVDVQCVAINNFLKSEIDKPIDILNIDVETMEPRILGVWDWDLCRPKIISVEIHSRDIREMLKSDAATILERSGYAPISRGLMSTMFVDAAYLK